MGMMVMGKPFSEPQRGDTSIVRGYVVSPRWGSIIFVHYLPTAYAVGYLVTPLRGG